MNLSHEYFMKQALKMAYKAFDEDEVPIGAVVVHDKQIIGRGYNQTKRLNDPTAHAEMIAITAACNYVNSSILDTCTLYVTIEPCAMCTGALKWARMEKLVYGAPEPKSGFNRYHPSILHSNTGVVSGILLEECKKPMLDFFRKKRIN